ncbi:hypothetical protein EG328_006535 [Venturia inaequalis]|uniref:SET domain-containing protein n=1 Tax=Venturia inaequalis TaxID=5025 RepID=A0A8H3UI45_VENIN|nr:hypothetical protein EG328_006535 [Venturia inaequalis]RDI82010.1 hypothetical protein Vi05172_g8112 [Venturia inaequalis]
MRVSKSFGAALCLARVFSHDSSPSLDDSSPSLDNPSPNSDDSSPSLDLPLGVGRDLQALIDLQKNDTATDPDFIYRHEIHTLQHDIPYNPESECIWDTPRKQRYCVFTHPEFDHGKGISIVTTPQRAKVLFETSLSSASKDHGFAQESSSYRTVARVEGKGRGMFANRRLPAGSIITQDAPILFIDHNWMQDKAPGEYYEALLASAVEKLPETTRQTFEDLHAQRPEGLNSWVTKMWTNTYELAGGPRDDWPGLNDEEDLGMLAIHANISKINHSCRPNTASQWDWASLSHKLYALRDIAADEELTMAYFDTKQSSQDRHQYLTERLNFECGCNLCKAENKTIDLSDDRISEILMLETYLENRQIAPADSTEMAELLVSLYEQERLYTYMAKAYALAAIEWNGVGQEYKARAWAYKSVQAGMIVGESAMVGGYADDMDDLLDGARAHWSWRHRVH